MMFDYILQVIFFQMAFLLIYEFWLQKETFFDLNRIYLLVTPVISFLIPFIRIKSLQETAPALVFQNISDKTIIWLPEVFIGGAPKTETTAIVSGTDSNLNWWLILYLLGVAITLGVFLYKLYRLEKISRSSRPVHNKYFSLYEIPDSNAAFTYSNRLYVGENISKKEREQIIHHELVHLHERHGVDLMIFELMKIAFWFNPMVYLYQSRLATLHEYIADEDTVQKSGKKQYFESLLNTAFGTSDISFTNQFFNHSLVKKRIFMLQKNKSSQLSKFKFLLVIPLMLAMLTYVACSDVETREETDSSLSQYNYSLQKGEDLDNDPEKKKIHQAYEDFLINNPDHVSWATIDYEADRVSYSVHKASEEVPESYNKMTVSLKDGREYIMYMNLKATGTNTTVNQQNYEEKNSTTWDGKNPVPYALMERVPAFPGCEKWEHDVRKNCTSGEIANFVNKNFDTDLGKKLGLTGINRVIVQFRIDEKGNITDIKSRAPHPELEKEAERVIASLPQMQPGEQNGRPVSVMYSLPIAFKVSE